MQCQPLSLCKLTTCRILLSYVIPDKFREKPGLLFSAPLVYVVTDSFLSGNTFSIFWKTDHDLNSCDTLCYPIFLLARNVITKSNCHMTILILDIEGKQFCYIQKLWHWAWLEWSYTQLNSPSMQATYITCPFTYGIPYSSYWTETSYI